MGSCVSGGGTYHPVQGILCALDRKQPQWELIPQTLLQRLRRDCQALESCFGDQAVNPWKLLGQAVVVEPSPTLAHPRPPWPTHPSDIHLYRFNVAAVWSFHFRFFWLSE